MIIFKFALNLLQYSMAKKIHYFSKKAEHIIVPDKFTCPFHYTPHPLCIMAAEEVQCYIQSKKEWQQELQKGKMFGVLVVREEKGNIGFLAAFSGLLAGLNIHDYFVPPIYDLQHPDGFFRTEEAIISNINTTIDELETDSRYLDYKKTLLEEQQIGALAIGIAKMQMQKDKMMRETKRQQYLTPEEKEALIHESQHQKAELKRLKNHHAQRIATIQAHIDQWQIQIDTLKNERKQRSATLQRKLFAQFKIHNFLGEVKNLYELFEHTGKHIPPAGAGECAAPRLLQYAILHKLHPIAMAEFWWGDSPRTELRRHGYYYPACKSKCEPILQFMLKGVDVEDNPLLKISSPLKPEIVWEDEWIAVVYKPAGVLSVPGKSELPSVEKWFKTQYPTASGPLLVHRLDMATSGLILVAKEKKVHTALQRQFQHQQIKKRYIALLNGIISHDEGSITLPLCLDPDDRPRQLVNFKYGKTAITHYRVIARKENITRIAFYPITGRTHQLRVHAAHPLGLNTPILGDELYGQKADRLFLHAEVIEFQHPITNKKIYIEKKADF